MSDGAAKSPPSRSPRRSAPSHRELDLNYAASVEREAGARGPGAVAEHVDLLITTAETRAWSSASVPSLTTRFRTVRPQRVVLTLVTARSGDPLADGKMHTAPRTR